MVDVSGESGVYRGRVGTTGYVALKLVASAVVCKLGSGSRQKAGAIH